MSEVNNRALKALVAKMSNGGLSPKTITGNYVPVVKMVVASAVDEQGEQIYPRIIIGSGVGLRGLLTSEGRELAVTMRRIGRDSAGF